MQPNIHYIRDLLKLLTVGYNDLKDTCHFKCRNKALNTQQ